MLIQSGKAQCAKNAMYEISIEKWTITKPNIKIFPVDHTQNNCIYIVVIKSSLP